jgi:hypothetical protein
MNVRWGFGEDGGHAIVPSMIALMAALESVTVGPQATVAMTLSAASLMAVGALVFKAGEWRGEHRALQQKVSDGYASLEKRMDEKFSEIRQDIHDLRKGHV